MQINFIHLIFAYFRILFLFFHGAYKCMTLKTENVQICSTSKKLCFMLPTNIYFSKAYLNTLNIFKIPFYFFKSAHKCIALLWHFALSTFAACVHLVCNPSKWVSRSLSPVVFHFRCCPGRHKKHLTPQQSRHQSDDDVIKVIWALCRKSS